jgi:hypothetical protein
LIICYSDFNNAVGQVVSFTVGSFEVSLGFGALGAINFQYRYQYSSGAFQNTEAFPKGLIFLIGSENNTQSFSNPVPSKIKERVVGAPGTGSLLNRTEDVLINSSTVRLYGYDFLNLLIRPNTLKIYHNIFSGAFIPDASYSLYASNNNQINDFNWQDLNFYQLISPTITSTSQTAEILVSDLSFWRFLLLRVVPASNTTYVSEIEFYSSSALTPSINFV